jgi:hypothetical protein
VSQEPQRRRAPEVNLLIQSHHAAGEPARLSRRKIELGLVLLVVLLWSGVALGLTALMGWHLDLGWLLR